MHDEDVFALTRAGEQQLRGGKTDLSAAELDLLVRIDGVLPVGTIRRAMPAVAQADFDAMLVRLARRGLIEPSRGDPFADRIPFTPTRQALDQARSQAAAAAASLQRAGYYVRIARTRAPRKPAGELLHAVVVEDEEPLAKFLRHYLAFEGFQVRTAANRAEIMEVLRTPPLPDLVLLDVVLPDADGFDILYKMRAHPAFRDVPVIMLTGKATRASVIKGLAGGADGYVTKPFEADALLEAVRTVTGLPDEPAGPGLSLV